MQYSRLSVFVHVQTRVCHAFVYDCIPCIRFIRLVIRLHLLYYYYSQMNTCFLQSRTGSRWQSRWSLRAPPFYNSLIYSKAHSFYVLIFTEPPGLLQPAHACMHASMAHDDGAVEIYCIRVPVGLGPTRYLRKWRAKTRVNYLCRTHVHTYSIEDMRTE
jgi:hypothetical protein